MKSQNNEKVKYVIKRSLVWIARIALILFCLMIIVGIYLTTSPGENFVRSQVKNQLQNVLHQNVEIARLETNLLSHLQINDLRIYQGKNDSIIPFVNLNELIIRYNFWQLILRNIDLDMVQVDGLQVYALKDSSGFYNFPAFESSYEEPDSTKETNSFDFFLGEVTLNNAAFHYNDKSIPLSGNLRNFDFQLENKKANNYLFKIRSYQSDVTYDQKLIPISSIEVDGDFINRKLSIQSTTIQLPGYQLSGTASIDLNGTSPDLEGNFQLNGSPEELSTVFKEYLTPQLYPIKGELNFSLELSGNTEEPNITTQINFPELYVSDIALTEGKIQTIWQNDLIELQRFNVRMLEGDIFGTGQLYIGESLSHSVDLKLNNVDLEKIWNVLYREASPYQGKINGQISSTGLLQNPDSIEFLGKLIVEEMNFEQKPLPDFMADVSMKNGIINLDIHQAESEIKANIKYKEENLQGDFTIDIFDLKPFAGLFNLMGLNGMVNIQGDLSGKTNSLNINSSFTANNLTYQNFPLDELAGSLSYKNDQIYFKECSFRGQLAEIDSTNPPLNLSGLKGGFSYQGQLHGSLENPNGNFSLNFQNPKYEYYQMDSLSLQLTTSNKIINLDKFQLNRDSISVLVLGEYSLAKSFGEFRIGIEDELPETEFPITGSINLADTNKIKFNMVCSSLEIGEFSKIIPQTAGASGDLNFNFNFIGNIERPQADLTFQIDQPDFQQVKMDSITGHVQLKSNYLYFRKLELIAEGNRSWVEGRIQLRKLGEKEFAFTENSLIDLTAEGDEIDLRIINPLLSPEAKITGTSSYRFEFDGSLKNPKLNGEFELTSGEFEIDQDSPPITNINIDLELEDSLLIIKQFKAQLQKTPFSLKGRIMANREMQFESDLYLSILNREVLQGIGTITKDKMDFDLNIKKLDLSLFQPLMTEVINLAGVVNSDIKIEGSFSHPDVNGNLSVTRLSFQPIVMNTALTDGIVKLNFNGNQVRLDTLNLKLNGGTIHSSGSFAYQDNEFTQLNFQTRIKNVKIDKPDEYLVTVNSAQIFYKKQDKQYLLDGDIVLGETKLVSNFKPQAILPFTKKVEQPAQSPSPIMKQTRMNVRIRESENIWVDNNLAHIRLHSEIELIGNLAQPNVAGRISVEEGYILYLDRKFQMEKGTIDFIDPNRLNPIVDLEAKTSVTTYERLEATLYDITLKITGELDQAKVELTSDPPLERSDIIALLTVGATRKQLTGKSGSGQDVSTSQILEQRIQTLSSKIISGYAGKTLEKLFGLEDVNIQGNLFRANKGSGPQLVASKRISNAAKLTYTTTVGHLNEQGIRLDYRLSKHYSFEGQTDQKGESSLSIKYNLKFK